jgi:very-short-patch-repair endonuclease
MFVASVLRRVPGLEPSRVSLQRKVHGASGDVYFIDFVIEPVGGHRVLVEIDGTDKSPGAIGVDAVQRIVERKRADLIEAGYRVLNFSNEKVATRAQECLTELRAELSEAVPARRRSTESVPSESLQVDPDPTGKRSSRRLWIGAGALASVAVVAAIAVWPSGEPGVEPRGTSCPASSPIKGNLSQSGEKIFHEPGWRYFESTIPERCFGSAGEASDAGYRASEAK